MANEIVHNGCLKFNEISLKSLFNQFFKWHKRWIK